MNDDLESPQRRQMVFSALSAIIIAPLGSALLRAQTQTLPHLSEDDRIAKALKYHHNANEAPRSDKAGTPAKEQYCHNCQYSQADSGQWRPCQLFPGKAVNADGWCANWALQGSAS